MKSLKIFDPVLWLLIAIENGPFSSLIYPLKMVDLSIVMYVM